MNNSIVMLEDVDLIRYLGNNEYHVIFISYVEENGGQYNVYEPNCRFNKDNVVNAFCITANQNITMYISEFETLEDAIRYVSNETFGTENIQNIDVDEAVKLIDNKPDTIIAYSQIQIN